MADWNIKPRASHCSGCNAPFQPGMSGHSLLDPTDEGYQRRDLCPACFKALPRVAGQVPSGAWTFTVPKATTHKAKEEPVQKETAEHLLRVLSERGDPADQGVIYVLAILLERTKQFIERKVTTAPDGKRIRHYEQKSSGDLFTIVDPALRAEDLPAVQQRVLALLEGPAQTASSPVRAKVLRFKRHRPSYPGVLRKVRV